MPAQKKMLCLYFAVLICNSFIYLEFAKEAKNLPEDPGFQTVESVCSDCHWIWIFTAFAGSGVDICIFSMITLLFRVSEKTATPTTVVLMVDPLLDAAQKKMLFVSIWSSFAIALFILNSQKKRKTYQKIPDFKLWKAWNAGIFTAFAGSGVDICIFSMITLLFRVSEKTATPTTVVLMGMNSVVGGYYRLVWEGDVPNLALDYLKVSIPVGVTLAPFGSFLGSHFHRQVLACFIYVLEALSVIGFLLTRPEMTLIYIGMGIIFAGFVFFSVISKAGEWLMERNEKGSTPSSIAKDISKMATA
ncbi:hypothetical protein COOONC_15208 [Cooperia oncophora]